MHLKKNDIYLVCRETGTNGNRQNVGVFSSIHKAQETVVLTDKSGTPQKAYLETVHRWPNRKAKVTVKVLKREPIKDKS